MYKVEFLRLNKNVWIVVFIGFTSAQISTILSVLSPDFSDVDYTVTATFTASSIQAPGYSVVQLDRKGKILPPLVKDLIRNEANNVLAGVSAI